MLLNLNIPNAAATITGKDGCGLGLVIVRGLGAHDDVDFVVATSQVTGRVGIVHIIVMGDAAGKCGEQFIASRGVVQAFGQMNETLGRFLVEPKCRNSVGKDWGGGRLSHLHGFFILAKGRWRYCLIRLLFSFLFFGHNGKL